MIATPIEQLGRYKGLSPGLARGGVPEAIHKVVVKVAVQRPFPSR